jgi:methionyl-tRNA synthetase
VFVHSFAFFRLPSSSSLCHMKWILKEKCDIVNHMKTVKPEIKYDDFAKVDVRLGTILSVEKVEKSDKLLKLEVDFGELGKRQILSGIAAWYQPVDLIGRQTTFVLNLEPRKMMGLDSQGMLFAVGLNDDSKPVFLLSQEKVENGDGAR